MMITRARTSLGRAILAASLAAAAPAFAAEKRPASKNLPGVEGNYQIVKPHVPEADQAPAAKTGGWDVKVSGQLTIDVGTRGLPLPRN